MRVAIYARVSTEEQESSNQLKALTEWAKVRGLEVAKVYQESASAWRDGHQKELAHLLHDATFRRFDIVLVWALDRLSREGSLKILLLIKRLGNYGIRVWSKQEPWTEMPSEFVDILYALTGWVAHMESKRLSERTKAGLVRAKAESGGKLAGRGKDKKRRKKRAVITSLEL